MNRIFSVLLTSLSISNCSISLANANPAPQESPPVKRQPARNSQAAGTRGCPLSSSRADILLLTSSQQIQSTVSPHPAFFWYLNNIEPLFPPQLRFTLIQPGVPQAIYETKITAKSSGLWILKLPKNTPGLALGQKYRWTVTLICNEFRPSSNKSIWAWIQRIPLRADIEQKIKDARTSQQRSQAFQDLGLEHDAYEALIASFISNSENITVLSPQTLPQTLQTSLSRHGYEQNPTSPH